MGARPSSYALTTPGPVRMYSTAEMVVMKPPSWLIAGVLPSGGLVGLYGAPGVKKSFVAIDIALSVASGVPWQGRTVDQGYPLYIAAEGGSGNGKRIKAWLLDRKLKASQAEAAWLTESVPVYADSNGMDRIFERIEELDLVPDLIVIDTLARCFDGDENQQEDMGRFVAGVDRLRKDLGATVIVVHHTRLDGERERGNTAFRGAADTMLSLNNRKGKLILACNKQKDSEEFEDLELRTRDIPEADSIVISASVPRDMGVSLRKTGLLTTLRDSGPLSWDAWFSLISRETEMPRSTFGRYVREMSETGKIIRKNRLYEASVSQGSPVSLRKNPC